MGAGGQAWQGGGGWDGGLEGPAVGAFDALAFACVAGVGAPAAAGLVQTLSTGSVPRTVLRCSRDRPNHFNHHSKCFTCSLLSSEKRTWTSAESVPLHALAEGEGGHVCIGVDALLHVAAPHALGAAAGALAAGGSHGTRGPALLGTVVG